MVRDTPGQIDGMVISCDDCVMQHTAACADCVVTHVLGADDQRASCSTSRPSASCGCSSAPAWSRASATADRRLSRRRPVR